LPSHLFLDIPNELRRVVGHTHWICDQMFALISKKIKSFVSGLLSYDDLVHLLRWTGTADKEEDKKKPPVWEHKVPEQVDPENPLPGDPVDPFEDVCGKALPDDQVHRAVRACAGPKDRVRVLNKNLKCPNSVSCVSEAWDLDRFFEDLYKLSRARMAEEKKKRKKKKKKKKKESPDDSTGLRNEWFMSSTHVTGVNIFNYMHFQLKRREHEQNPWHVCLTMDSSTFGPQARSMIRNMPLLS